MPDHRIQSHQAYPRRNIVPYIPFVSYVPDVPDVPDVQLTLSSPVPFVPFVPFVAPVAANIVSIENIVIPTVDVFTPIPVTYIIQNRRR